MDYLPTRKQFGYKFKKLYSSLSRTQDRLDTYKYRHKFKGPAADEKMGYLRGTTAPKSKATMSTRSPGSRRATLANKVTALERKVNRMKPEIQQLNIAQTVAAGATGVQQHNVDITRRLVDDASFRDNITGDKWVNRSLILRVNALSPGIARMRLVVYRQNRESGPVWSPAAGFEFTESPDMSEFKVMTDRIITQDSATGILYLTFKVPLNITTTYDSGDDVITKNKVKTALIYTTTGVGGVIAANHELLYSNK